MLQTNTLKAGVVVLALVLAGCGNDDDTAGGQAASGDRDWGDFGENGDIVQGDPDAPVSVIEYASVTCGHCASFHVYTYPFMKEEYIDTGLVRYTMRALPTPPMTMARLGFMTASCVGEDRYYAFIDALMRNQSFWAFNQDMNTNRANLGQIAAMAGLTEAEVQACQSDQARLDAVNASSEGALEIGVNTTPTFFINGTQVNGMQAWETFEPMIIEHLPPELRPAQDEEAEEAVDVEG